MTTARLDQQDVHTDLTVVGGGLAGVCAAIAAARQGATVALVQNRPVLGGNSSSEVRVWVCGALAHGQQSLARETGIMGELFVENQFRNPQGNPYYWDLVVLEAVRAEPNISLYLNTDVRDLTTQESPSGISVSSVTGFQMGSEKVITFTSPSFIDATGDGLIGYLAGAEHRTGRESRAETGEAWAPEVPDGNTLGSTILFYSRDTGRPEKFVPPSFSKDISTTAIPSTRPIRVDAYGCAYWWIEWGGELDVVADNERIRDELQAICYGIWDHIKNSGEFDADTLTLEWIGAVPGKREYRRFVGDHVLTQHDILGQEEFEDRVAFGGWSIDLHPAGGVYASEPGSRHWYSDGVYHVPLRSLYSRNVSNMWMAGRDISATHVAFGSTRVMATCAVIGEAAGLAAAIAVQERLSPREIATEHFDLVRNALVRSDASVMGLEHTDEADLALTAEVTASSTLTSIVVDAPGATHDLAAALAVVLPADPALGDLELLLDADEAAELVVEIHTTSRPQNYLPDELVQQVAVPVAAGEKQWLNVPLAWQPDRARNAFVVMRGVGLRAHLSKDVPPGIVAFRLRDDPPADTNQEWRPWKPMRDEGVPCLRVAHTAAYRPDLVVGGYQRPYGGPQLWSSQPLTQDPEPTLELTWPQPVTVGEVSVVLDDDVDVDLINLHHHTTPHEVLPTLVRDYRIEAVMPDGGTSVLADVTGNRARHRRHRLDAPVQASMVRLVATATNGAPCAHVVSLRTWRAE